MKNQALKDAFMKTEAGRSLCHTARSSVVGDRIRNLKTAAHNVFVENFHRWDIFAEAREYIRELGVRGGAEYDRVLKLVQYALIDKEAYKEAVATLAPEANRRHEEAGQRIRTLDQLVFETYARNGRHDVYYHSKDRVRKLGRKGGEEYEHVLTAVKFAAGGGQSWKDGILSLCPPKPETVPADDAEAAALAADCESSDGLARHA
jgi:general stress protein YciG